MYYELYIDVFFLVNFMMDYILLCLVRRILKCSATHGRICIGAAAGALCTCVIMVIPGMNMFVKFILFHIVSNVVMIKTGLKIGWNKTFLRAYILLYISAFIVGGVMEHLYQYVRVGSLFFVIAIAGYYISLGVWNLSAYLAGRNAGRIRVRLVEGDREYETEALLDTGNRLRDPVTGKPVSVISKEAAEKLGIEVSLTLSDIGGEEAESRKKFWYIPYHSIGESEGLMTAVMLKRMDICKNPQIRIEKPVIAICEEYITADDYEMLLNPDLL